MKKGPFNQLTAGQQAEIDALIALPDDQIDTSDAPELSDWSEAKRGLFYRPIKRQITLRIDADVLDWFKCSKSQGKGYQTDINSVLRDHVMRHNAKK